MHYQLTNIIHAFSQVKFKNKLAIKMLQKSIKELTDSKEKAETEYLNLIKKTHNDEFEIIKSIPGIGEGTAAQLITTATVGNFSRFDNSRKLVSYLGLSPTKKNNPVHHDFLQAT